MMIQRIQSVYLLLIIIGSILLFVFPVAEYRFSLEGTSMQARLELISTTNASETIVNQSGFINPAIEMFLPIIIVLIGVSALITLFVYKKRILQIRLIAFAVLLNVIYIALLFFGAIEPFAKALGRNFSTTISTNYSVGTFIPLVTLILFVLAQRAIKSDERLVRSADRLR